MKLVADGPPPPQLQQRLLGRHRRWPTATATGRSSSTFIETSVIGHEMSHGVVQFSGGLDYQGQSGALNESFADVFGAMIRQYRREAPTSTRATG